MITLKFTREITKRLEFWSDYTKGISFPDYPHKFWRNQPKEEWTVTFEVDNHAVFANWNIQNIFQLNRKRRIATKRSALENFSYLCPQTSIQITTKDY